MLDEDCKESKGEWVLESESVVERRGDGEQANGDGEGTSRREGESSVAGDALFMGFPGAHPSLAQSLP